MNTARTLFPGAMGPDGFISCFDHLLDDSILRRKLILKGGPGVGKSTFMRRVHAALCANGEPSTLYFCSGDPDSLDGVARAHAVLDEAFWLRMLEDQTERDNGNACLSGLAAAILLERGKMPDDRLQVLVRRRLSPGMPVDRGAGWFAGLAGATAMRSWDVVLSGKSSRSMSTLWTMRVSNGLCWCCGVPWPIFPQGKRTASRKTWERFGDSMAHRSARPSMPL